MKIYFVHINDVQSGPFNKEELKELGITKEIMVWYEGIEFWVCAGEIAELTDVLKVIPPPLISSVNHSKLVEQNVSKAEPEQKDLTSETKKNASNSSKSYLTGAIALVLLIGFFVFIYVDQKSKQEELQYQLELQNAKLLEQERIEEERKAEELRAQRAAKLSALRTEYDQALTNLRAAKMKMDEINEFRLLRTRDEKEQQVRDQLEVIRYWENEEDRLRKVIESF
jgi:hypothetical protein